jgi:hypothetical protein
MHAVFVLVLYDGLSLVMLHANGELVRCIYKDMTVAGREAYDNGVPTLAIEPNKYLDHDRSSERKKTDL